MSFIYLNKEFKNIIYRQVASELGKLSPTFKICISDPSELAQVIKETLKIVQAKRELTSM